MGGGEREEVRYTKREKEKRQKGGEREEREAMAGRNEKGREEREAGREGGREKESETGERGGVALLLSGNFSLTAWFNKGSASQNYVLKTRKLVINKDTQAPIYHVHRNKHMEHIIQ